MPRNKGNIANTKPAQISRKRSGSDGDDSFHLLVTNLYAPKDDEENSLELLDQKSEKSISSVSPKNRHNNRKKDGEMLLLDTSINFTDDNLLCSKSETIDKSDRRAKFSKMANLNSSCPMLGYDWSGSLAHDSFSSIPNDSETSTVRRRRARRKTADGGARNNSDGKTEMSGASERRAKRRSEFKRSMSCDDLNPTRKTNMSRSTSEHVRAGKSSRSPRRDNGKLSPPKRSAGRRYMAPERSMSSDCVVATSKNNRKEALERFRAARRTKSNEELASLRSAVKNNKKTNNNDDSSVAKSLEEQNMKDKEAEELIQNCQKLLDECRTLSLGSKEGERLDDSEGVVENCKRLLKDCRSLSGEMEDEKEEDIKKISEQKNKKSISKDDNKKGEGKNKQSKSPKKNNLKETKKTFSFRSHIERRQHNNEEDNNSVGTAETGTTTQTSEGASNSKTTDDKLYPSSDKDGESPHHMDAAAGAAASSSNKMGYMEKMFLSLLDMTTPEAKQ